MDNKYTRLLEFCETDVQRQVMELLSNGHSYRAAARILGRSPGSIGDVVSRVDRVAVTRGVSPAHDMTHSVPDPYIVKGVSTYYNEEGRPIGQWVKSTVDQDKLSVVRKLVSDEFLKELPRYVPGKGKVSSKKSAYMDRLVVYPIADVHLGMLSWGEETGADYDVTIAEETIRRTITSLIDRSPACEECLIENLGDLLHVDNQIGITARSGNVLDVDGRYAKIMQAGIRVIRYVIEYSLAKHRKVTVINCCGNHDDLGSLWLSAALKNIYENEKRITVVAEPCPRHYYEYGSTLIGCTHGSDVKAKDLPLVMAAEKGEAWGRTRFHFIHMGHVHHDHLVEIGKCKVEAFRAVCSKDAWTNTKGYLSGRDLKALFFEKDGGEVERHIVAIK